MSTRPTYLFTGDRGWGDPYIVDMILTGIQTHSKITQERPIIVHGAAHGLDTIAGSKAQLMDMTVHAYPAEWALGKKAGVLRNQKMLMEEDVNVVFAFHDDLKKSRGTRDMVERALMTGITTYVIGHG